MIKLYVEIKSSIINKKIKIIRNISIEKLILKEIKNFHFWTIAKNESDYRKIDPYEFKKK